jgi:hypothetical protein
MGVCLSLVGLPWLVESLCDYQTLLFVSTLLNSILKNGFVCFLMLANAVVEIMATLYTMCPLPSLLLKLMLMAHHSAGPSSARAVANNILH